VVAILAVLGALTSLASVPLQDGGGSQVVRSHRAVFALPDGWTRTGSRTYAIGVRLPGGLTCRMLETTRATLRHAPPARDFDVQERGTSGTLRWYLGTSDEGLRAVAARRAPASLRSSRRLYTSYEMTLRAEDQSDSCANAALKQRGALRRAIRSVHLRRRA
jgi:hypothetical protein